jgi:hypothetical protein
MKLCNEHSNEHMDFLVIYPKEYSACPHCVLQRKYEDIENELKEVKTELTEIKVKMAPEMSEDSVEEDR